MASKSRNSLLYRVHPDLMYRQITDSNNEKFNAIREDFEAHRIAANRRRKKHSM
ncbi:hypothetical protein [Peribacillus saganii]|uniref:hypothetical protein n=1 Tax=Peribacillus saganii TaxID=2303992 RepID=UPI0013145CB8|nr:hypothetical protein [Peribacillus saganii]